MLFLIPNTVVVFDVYCTAKFSVKIVDFNPFCEKTDGLLFDWQELLETLDQKSTDFRFVESNSAAQGNQPAYTHNRLPREAFDFSSDGASIAEFVERFNQELLKDISW